MNSGKDIFTNLFDLVGATDPDRKTLARSLFNQYYHEAATRFSWASLRQTVTLAFSSSASSIWLPADLAGIDLVYDSTNELVFTQVHPGSRSPAPAQPCFYIERNQSPLYWGSAVSMNLRSSTIAFSGDFAWDADYVGEWIWASGVQGPFEIASETTITQPSLVKVSGENFQLRPAGQLKMTALAAGGDAYASSISLDYWRFPRPLLLDDQFTELPDVSFLLYRVAADIIGMMDRRREDAHDLRARFREHMLDAEISNRPYSPPFSPRGQDRAVLGWGAR